MLYAILEKLSGAGVWQAVGAGIVPCLVILIVVVRNGMKKSRPKKAPPTGRIPKAGESTVQQTTIARPLEIENPAIGFLNLMGDVGAELLEADRNVLSPLFQNCEVSTGATPKCQVLFVYCGLDATGQMAGCQTSLRDLIKEAGAYVAVLASENNPDSCVKAMETRNDWHANIVLCFDRNGDTFAPFFRDLFSRMFQGTSMLKVWVALAPQIPGVEHPDGPNLAMVAEAGHIVFRQSRPN